MTKACSDFSLIEMQLSYFYRWVTMLNVQDCNCQDVAAVVTAMTDAEKPFLREAVEALLSDSGIGQAIICVEEGNVWVEEVLASLVTDPRLEIVRMPMAYLGAVRNQALNYVKMTWVGYCDGDDVWCKGKTLVQRTYAEMAKSDFVGADHYLTDETGSICAFASSRHIPMPSSWIVRAETMRQYPFSNSLSQAEDGEWWIRTSNSVKKVRCPKMLLKYRVRSNSLSSNTPSKRRKAKVIAFASKPVLREVVLFATWCIWLVTRQERYVWLKEWEMNKYSENTHAK